VRFKVFGKMDGSQSGWGLDPEPDQGIIFLMPFFFLLVDSLPLACVQPAELLAVLPVAFPTVAVPPFDVVALLLSAGGHGLAGASCGAVEVLSPVVVGCPVELLDEEAPFAGWLPGIAGGFVTGTSAPPVDTNCCPVELCVAVVFPAEVSVLDPVPLFVPPLEVSMLVFPFAEMFNPATATLSVSPPVSSGGLMFGMPTRAALETSGPEWTIPVT
jgi:hypothetical protein